MNKTTKTSPLNENEKANWFKAILNKSVDDVKKFLSNPNFDIECKKTYLNLGECTALHIAVLKSYTQIVKLLLEHGADVMARTSEGGYTPLHLSASGKQTEILQMLINHPKQEIDAQDSIGFTALLLAAVYNRKQNMELLLSAGANLHHTEQDGDTVLHFSIDKNNVECAKLALERGININVQDKHGWTALHVAAR